MKVSIATFLFVIASLDASACEFPTDESSYFHEAMREERELTLQALAKSDLVFVGTVSGVRFGAETKDPVDRISTVTVTVHEMLAGKTDGAKPVVLRAKLHQVTVGCFGNETFWDDQVELKREYIFFVSDGQILSASPPSPSWRHLGLSGQREIVLAVAKNVPGPSAAQK